MIRAGVSVLGVCLLSEVLAGCVSSPRFTLSRGNEPHGDDATSFVEEGVASYYADDFNGRRTSNGEVYDMNSMTGMSNPLRWNPQ